jgi:hypothetical protein
VDEPSVVHGRSCHLNNGAAAALASESSGSGASRMSAGSSSAFRPHPSQKHAAGDVREQES